MFGDVFGGLIGRNEAIDLHRSPAAPMVRWIWEPSGITKLLRFLCRFSECFSSWIGDGKQVHVVVVERESALRTVMKEETLQSAVIIPMFPSSPKWSQHPSAFSVVFARILGASSAIWWRAS